MVGPRFIVKAISRGSTGITGAAVLPFYLPKAGGLPVKAFPGRRPNLAEFAEFTSAAPISMRYSLNSLLLVMGNVVLLITALDGCRAGTPRDAAAQSGLSFCALAFSLLCRLFKLSPGRTLVRCGLLYAWGTSCLLFAEIYGISATFRWLFSLLGIAFVLWTLFMHDDVKGVVEFDPGQEFESHAQAAR